MPINYFLAPNPQWQFTKNDALYNVKGRLYTYRSIAHDEEKPTYQDPTGLIPHSNPIILDGVGSVIPIYWADDEFYYIELRDENDAMIWFLDNFPKTSGGGNGPISVEVDYDNQLLNGQFRFHNAAALSGFSAATEYNIAQSWFFYKDNATATDKIMFKEFLPGSPPSSIEGNPKYYFNYECTVAGTAESTKYISQYIQDVRSYAGKTVSFSLVAMSSVATSVNVDIVQYFGTGGSPSPINIVTVGTINITTSWDKHSLLGLDVDALSSKTIGANGDDRFEIRISLPFNTTSVISFTNIQLNLGDKILEFQYNQANKDYSYSLPNIIESRNRYWENDYGDFPIEQSQYCVLGKDPSVPNWCNTYNSSSINLVSSPPVGSIFMWPTEIIPPDYLLCNGTYHPVWKYPRLYNTIANRYTTPTSNHSATSVQSGPDVTVTMSAFGTVTHAADVNTGFTFVTVQIGNSTTKEIFKITCTSGASFSGGEYFTFMYPDLTRCLCWLCVDGNYLKKPNIPSGTEEYKLYIRKTDTANQIATKLLAITNRTAFAVPNIEGYFVRGTANGSTTDPDRLTRHARQDGVSGDIVGTLQDSMYNSHFHKPAVKLWDGNVLGNENNAYSGGGPVAFGPTLAGSIYEYRTEFAGGNESRPVNIGMNFIIKY